MNERLTDEQNQAILAALNKAIDEGPWSESNFLKAIGKNLVGMRDKFLAQVNAKTPEQSKEDTQAATRMALRSGQKLIFVSLYSADGSNMQSWEKIIINLPRQIISRPVYEFEENLQAALKTKENKTNEAYVAIYVNPQDILPLSADRASLDKLGTKLLSLKDKVLHVDNIVRFVHVSGVYEIKQGRLIKNSQTD